MNFPQSSPNGRRVFVACLLSFLLSISPLAAVAATMKSSVARASQPVVPAPSSAPAQPKKEEIVHQTGEVSTTDSFLSLFAPVGTPTIVATKVDAFPDHSNGGKARPGDAITYTVTITNTGTGDATGVQFNDAIDPNTTFVPGSTTTQPIAVDD